MRYAAIRHAILVVLFSWPLLARARQLPEAVLGSERPFYVGNVSGHEGLLCVGCVASHPAGNGKPSSSSSGTFGHSFWHDASLYCSLEGSQRSSACSTPLIATAAPELVALQGAAPHSNATTTSSSSSGEGGGASGGNGGWGDAHAHSHKPLLPLNGRDWLGLVLATVALFVAAGGGLGGGGILVPLYLVVLDFSATPAVALSNVTICGGAVANFVCNVWRRHPLKPRESLIDWDLILVMEGPTIVGALVGGYVNKVTPSWLTTSLLTLILAYMSYKLLARAVATYRAETALRHRGTTPTTTPSMAVPTAAQHNGRVDKDDAVPEAAAALLPVSTTSRPTSPIAAGGDEQETLCEPLLPLPAAAATNGHVGVGVTGGEGEAYAPPPLRLTVQTGGGAGAEAAGCEARAASDDAAASGAPPSAATAAVDLGAAADKERRLEGGGGAADDWAGGGSGRSSSVEWHRGWLAALQRLHRRFPIAKVLVLVVLFAAVVVSDLLKETVLCGSTRYWLLASSAVPLIAAAVIGVRYHLVQQYERRQARGYRWARGDVRWTKRNTLVYPAVCSLAGLFAGMFGVGGGIVKGPLMLEMGVLPDVAAATSATMIMFTAASAAVVYASFGGIAWDYGAALAGVGLAATLAGQLATHHLMSRLKRRSVVVFAMAAMLVLSAAAVGSQAVWDVVVAVRGHSINVWGHVCRPRA